ncbi:BlaR1 family beta-lactam sensor/signal transducer [Rossellomorea arthrocnemi]|uniref:BlaR1 family beta-lactam sensor/signal transducer n=1 Tax=Rossellomorea arthrocnemi TaxID=2769542 RepID=UPI001918EF61|nr:BlaR1 family beta-lactam sensor/signal transducer [Rossellomorea arthrocnemi]
MILPQMLLTFGFSTITIAVIFLVRRFRLSAAWRYHLWLLLIAALTLPIFPKGLISFGKQMDVASGNSHAITPVGTSQGNSGFNGQWMQDFGTSVNQFDYSNLNKVFLLIWVAGIIALAVFFLSSHLQLNRLAGTARRIRSTDILSLFEKCKQDLGITKKIALLESSQVQSPLTFGFFRTTILLPKGSEQNTPLSELKYVILHELQHEKSHHTKVNYLFLFYQIVYWFNPFIWLAFREMRVDRELACDDAVLHYLDPVSYKEYGHTILSFFEQQQQPRFTTLTNQLSGSKKQIKKRISHIASFRRDSRLRLMKSIAIFVATTLFVLMQLPFFTLALGDEDYYDSKDQPIIDESLNTYFNDVKGSAVLYSLKDDRYHIYNEEKSRLRVSPDSTYKIYSALIGLEVNSITPGDSIIKWNGEPNEYKEWNRDQTLDTAIEHSVNWYFQALDRTTGEDKLSAYLDRLDYGNKDLSGGVGDYWLESSLKISPMEQVELLRSFYTNEQHFDPVNVETVKSALALEEKGDARLYGKTGTGIVNGETVNGWFIGFVETKDDTWFFATNTDQAGGSQAAEITMSILNKYRIVLK